jgi:hypothetical protein
MSQRCSYPHCEAIADHAVSVTVIEFFAGKQRIRQGKPWDSCEQHLEAVSRMLTEGKLGSFVMQLPPEAQA